MPNDDLTVGRCEALSDAKLPVGFGSPAMEFSLPSNCTPLEGVEWQIKHAEEQNRRIQAKLDTLYSLRSKLLRDPELAKAVQAALELLR